MIDFTFQIVLSFYALLVAVWVLWIIRKKYNDSIWDETEPLVKENLFRRLDLNRWAWKHRLTFSGLILLIFAASGPQIGTRVAPVERKGIDLVFALDVSESMNAQDVKPSRLEKAKFEISQMIDELKGDRIGLIVFAGSSHLYLPLTSDYEAAQLFLDAIDTKMIPSQGTDLSTALRTAISAFNEESEKYKVMVLVTDGEDHEGAAVELVSKAYKLGIIAHVVGVGTLK